jgi:hypothetical protein
MTRRVTHVMNRLGALAALIFLAWGCTRPDFTLTISGDDEAEGAKVFVNDQFAGSMKKLAGTGSHFVKQFPKGPLTIEVKKDGYRSFREAITVASDMHEHHLYAKLAPEMTPTDRTTGALPDAPPGSFSPPAALGPSGPPGPPPGNKIPVCPD